MKEIITVCVGQCGIRSAAGLFSLIEKEHRLEADNDSCQSFYNWTPQEGRQARLLAIDNDSAEIDRLMMSDLGRTIPLENMIFSGHHTSGNYAKARAECLPQISDALNDGIRRELQKCESPQLIQLHNSIGGGTGTAIGHAVLEYPFRLKSSVSVMPSQHLSSSLIEPYNAILGLRDLFHGCNQTLFFNNDSMYSHLKIAKQQKKVDLQSLNQLMTDALGDFTAADRYRRGESILKRMVSMLPYPDIHFFGYALGGPTSFGDIIELERTFLELHNPRYGLSGIDRMGVYIGMNILVRGDTATSPFYNIELKRLKQRLAKKRTWSQTRMEFSYSLDGLYLNTCPVSRDQNPSTTSLSCVFNNASMSQPLNKMADLCQRLFSKKAFLHLYELHNLEMDEINESLGDINSLIHEYSSFSSQDNACGGQEEDDSDCC